MDPATSEIVKELGREPFTKQTRRFLGLLRDREITHAQYAVLGLLADRTVSWRRLWTQLSVPEISVEVALSEQGVRNALKRLEELDLVVRRPFDQSFEYGLVPPSKTPAQVLAMTAAGAVDNLVAPPNSVEGVPPTHLGGSAGLTFVLPKKALRTSRGPVDKGLKGRADLACSQCHGEGWVVLVAEDGFTESVAVCSCTKRTA